MIDPDGLVTLAAISRTGSVAAAADELGFTPSAVSQQVKRLERRVGGALLGRVGRGVIPTELGRRLVVESEPILAALERLEAGLHAGDPQAPVVGTLRLAAFSTGVRGLVAPALAALADAAPGLEVEVLEWDPHDAVGLVGSGGADIALVHNWGELPLPIPAHVESKTLGIDRGDVLVPAAHPLAGRDSITATELAEEVWACAPVGSVCHSWLLHMFDLHGRVPQIRYWAMEFSSQIGLVEAGLGVALVPRLGRETLPNAVCSVPVTDPVPTRRILLLWRQSMAPSPAIHALRAALLAQANLRLDRP